MRLPFGWVIYNERRACRKHDAAMACIAEELVPYELEAMASIDRGRAEEAERWEKARRWDQLHVRSSGQNAEDTASINGLA